jgi:hypothetical protein
MRMLLPAAQARTPHRLIAAWRALRGRPVAYRVTVEGGLTISGASHAIVADCMFHGIPQAALTVTGCEIDAT